MNDAALLEALGHITCRGVAEYRTGGNGIVFDLSVVSLPEVVEAVARQRRAERDWSTEMASHNVFLTRDAT